MADEDEVIPPQQLSGDALLYTLNGAVNSADGNHVGIQLTIGGNLVDGVLVSADRWFEVITADMDATPGGESLASAIRLIAGHRFPEDDDLDAAAIAETSQYLRDTEYLHLLNAAHIGANGRTMNRRRPWRGRVTYVSGWAFGTTGLDDED